MQFYPSISSGYQKFHFINNDKLIDQSTCRFYIDNKPIMISAGHNYLFKNFRNDIGATTANVMSDSGGYQLITGAVTLDTYQCKMPAILQWMKNNCDNE